jgi:hypothetical protein
VTQILVALAAAAGVVVVGWLLVAGTQVLSRTRARRHAEGLSSIDAGDADWIYGDRAGPSRRIASQSSDRRQAISQGHRRPQTMSAEGEAETILRDAEGRAGEIRARAESERESLLEEQLASAERAALEVKGNAEREAEAIVKNAELKAGEALVGVERARRRLEQEMQELAREQALMAEKHKRLAEFLQAALEEIERASVNGSVSIAGLKDLHDKLRSAE